MVSDILRWRRLNAKLFGAVQARLCELFGQQTDIVLKPSTETNWS
jgi:hypothetical protein